MENKPIKVDVSEIKTYKSCRRQWLFTSRNRFHLRPIVTPSHFALGTIFHESLHMMYMGASLEKTMEFVRANMSNDNEVALLAMVPGYYKNVLPGDLDRYQVLDIEHHFDFMPTDPSTGEVLDADLHVCGSIDMIVLDPAENAIYGFEHKTCKNFRDSSFMWMDEQPRVYTYALQLYVEEYNAKHPDQEPATLGGIYINEVKKLLRDFKYQRTLWSILCAHFSEPVARAIRASWATIPRIRPRAISGALCATIRLSAKHTCTVRWIKTRSLKSSKKSSRSVRMIISRRKQKGVPKNDFSAC